MIEERIKSKCPPGTIIPKPRSAGKYVITGWGKSRGEDALVYQLPMKPVSKNPSTKRIPVAAFERAYEELIRHGEISRTWFKKEFPNLTKDGACNFTTLGGIFILLGEAVYESKGLYKKK
jgi:hypothetical protein